MSAAEPPAPPPRVRIHLNLAQPDRAECAVKVRSPRGGWITVGYSTRLVLENCIPVVETERQQAISAGHGKKTPHAFIEGDLVAFQGRIRSAAPASLVDQSRLRSIAAPDSGFGPGQPINYNPRFARCFYIDQPSKDQVDQKFDACGVMAVVGWSFQAHDVVSSLMSHGDFCPAQALAHASEFEKRAVAAGLVSTRRMLTGP